MRIVIEVSGGYVTKAYIDGNNPLEVFVVDLDLAKVGEPPVRTVEVLCNPLFVRMAVIGLESEGVK